VKKLPHTGLLLDPVEKDYIEGSYKKLVYADKTERYYYNPIDQNYQQTETINMFV